MNITIVGGGFGGVKAALELSRKKSNHITLISSNANFQYYPSLFSTATGHSYRESWVPLEKIFKKTTNVRIVIDTIVRIDPENRVVLSEKKTYKYDKVIFSLGSVTTYFGIEGLDVYSFGIKSEQEIRALQQHIMSDLADGREDERNYVIIGGGPTGVELAGALGEYIRVLRKHYGIRKKAMKISLIEAAPRLLPRLSESSSNRALKQLNKLGVNVVTNRKVERQTADSLVVNGRPLKTQTVIWTSGVTNAPFFKNNSQHFELDERGKVKVDEYMRVRPSVYVIGDNANTRYAGLAQTALHDAIFVAKHISGRKKAYKMKLPPCVVPVGHNWALFEWGPLRFGGWAGGIMRRAADLIGYSDVLPIGWAFGAWRAGGKKQMNLPDKLSFEDESPEQNKS